MWQQYGVDRPHPFELHDIEISLQEWPAFQINVRERRTMTIRGYKNMACIEYKQSGYGANFRCVASFRQIHIAVKLTRCPHCGHLMRR